MPSQFDFGSLLKGKNPIQPPAPPRDPHPVSAPTSSTISHSAPHESQLPPVVAEAGCKCAPASSEMSASPSSSTSPNAVLPRYRSNSVEHAEGGTWMTQQAVAGREVKELQELLEDPQTLHLVTLEAIKEGSLEDSSVLQRISDVSKRLLQRNEMRRTGLAFLESIHDIHTDPNKCASAMRNVCSCLWVTYGKTQYSKEEQQTGFLSKFYLHGLTGGGADETTLCIRFSLTEHMSEDGEESQYDLSLTALQVKPFVSHSAKFTFSFAMQDTLTADAADWALDEPQRHRLLELHVLLGLSAGYATAAAMLGFLLAAAGSSTLEHDPFLVKALQGTRTAHREELLANGGAFF